VLQLVLARVADVLLAIVTDVLLLGMLARNGRWQEEER
jgi:hypothetical protein